jgi:hypothetical protein
MTTSLLMRWYVCAALVVLAQLAAEFDPFAIRMALHFGA